MNLELIFSISNMLSVSGWIILAASIWLKPARVLVSFAIVPTMLAFLYAALIAAHFQSAPESGNFNSLKGLSLLFEYRPLLLAGWVHYLAFDLLIGTWELQDAQNTGIAFPILLPCLFMTLMFGPIGFLMYLLFRRWKTGSFRLHP